MLGPSNTKKETFLGFLVDREHTQCLMVSTRCSGSGVISFTTDQVKDCHSSHPTIRDIQGV